MATPTFVKSYNLINQDSFTGRRLELMQNGQTILWVNKDVPFMGQPTINIQTQSANGPIIAACKLMSMSGGVRVLFSEGEKQTVNPDATPKEQWFNILPNGWTNKEYEFRLGAGRYVWRRTHDAALGASSMGSFDFKLLDLSQGDDKANQKILAVYIKSSKLFDRHNIGRIDFTTELGLPLELMSMAAIFGIEEKIRRRKKSNAAAGGGGASAGAC